MFDILNNDNFILYAMKSYDKPVCIMSEFEEDLKRLKYIKRLIKKYKATGDLKERLILNHIIVLYNVFGPDASVRLLFLRTDVEDYPILKTFLLFLQLMPKVVIGINGHNINSSDVTVDLFVGKRLRENIR